MRPGLVSCKLTMKIGMADVCARGLYKQKECKTSTFWCRIQWCALNLMPVIHRSVSNSFNTVTAAFIWTISASSITGMNVDWMICFLLSNERHNSIPVEFMTYSILILHFLTNLSTWFLEGSFFRPSRCPDIYKRGHGQWGHQPMYISSIFINHHIHYYVIWRITYTWFCLH